MTLRPAAEGTGIRFRRVDRPGTVPVVAHPLNASVVDGLICLGDPGGTSVLGVDRLLAALAAAEIDNILIELSGPELPAMDGTPRPLLLLLECAGTVEQARPPRMLEMLWPVEVASALGRICLEPADGLQLAIEGPAAATDAIVTSWSKREARGAALDALGGLALIPAHITGRYVERNGDSALRCALAKALIADHTSYRITTPWPSTMCEADQLARAS